jgi:hypothetical protein
MVGVTEVVPVSIIPTNKGVRALGLALRNDEIGTDLMTGDHML